MPLCDPKFSTTVSNVLKAVKGLTLLFLPIFRITLSSMEQQVLNVFCTIVLTLLVNTCCSSPSSWILLGIPSLHKETLSVNPQNAKSHCHNLTALHGKQKLLCELNHDIMQAISKGAKLGIEECQHQFRNNRWNCSTFQNHSHPFGGVVQSRNREKAYINAVSSAGLAYAVTKACSQSLVTNCTCRSTVKSKSKSAASKWRWEGCSDDIEYGSAFSRSFLDTLEDNRTEEGLMNLHNNEAGRRILKSKMEKVCKCHGVSGSCTMRVCWRKLGTFRTVGDELMRKFEGATKVALVGKNRKPRLKPAMKNMKKPSKRDLVFVDSSINYCERNETLGILGTQGRRCNSTSMDTDSCKLLCCGRGYHTLIKTVEDKCNCKFIWCCRLDCQKCVVEKEEHFCN